MTMYNLIIGYMGILSSWQMMAIVFVGVYLYNLVRVRSRTVIDLRHHNNVVTLGDPIMTVYSTTKMHESSMN